MPRHIIAVGGALLQPETGNDALERYILAAAAKPRPRVCFVPTASGDSEAYVARFYETYAKLECSATHLPFFRRTPADLRALIFACDVVHVGGGNTRSMIATWRHWGFDAILREAWERGIVLCGSSAGSICWFAEGVTDSVAGSLTRMDCLGFLEGSNCPHYDGERERRPAYQSLVARGEIAPGIACDDGAGAHYVGEELHAVVASRPAARAYRVTRDGNAAREVALETRLLS